MPLYMIYNHIIILYNICVHTNTCSYVCILLWELRLQLGCQWFAESFCETRLWPSAPAMIQRSDLSSTDLTLPCELELSCPRHIKSSVFSISVNERPCILSLEINMLVQWSLDIRTLPFPLHISTRRSVRSAREALAKRKLPRYLPVLVG